MLNICGCFSSTLPADIRRNGARSARSGSGSRTFYHRDPLFKQIHYQDPPSFNKMGSPVLNFSGTQRNSGAQLAAAVSCGAKEPNADLLGVQAFTLCQATVEWPHWVFSDLLLNRLKTEETWISFRGPRGGSGCGLCSHSHPRPDPTHVPPPSTLFQPFPTFPLPSPVFPQTQKGRWLAEKLTAACTCSVSCQP